jgi:poly-gamma-glutamate system protein
MNKISIQSTLVLSVLASLAVAFIFLVELTKTSKKQDWFDEKMQASLLAKKALTQIKIKHYGNAEITDNINDPNETGLIGEEYSSITTGEGSLPIKLSTTNPNMAALAVQLLKDAGAEKGDSIAICMTGSFPALNISTLAAIQTLELIPIVVCSVTSSSWGATDPEFTWLDMLSTLNKENIIYIKPTAASIGGNQDIGMGLSQEGRQKVLVAIKRNEIPIISGGTLEKNIKERISIFDKTSKNIKVFINIGGGTASNGSDANGNAVNSGLNTNIKLSEIPDKQGVIFEMAKRNIPVIHLLNLEPLMKEFKIPRNPIPLPKIGSGELFQKNCYNVYVILACTLLLIGLIIIIAYQDKKRNELGTEIIQ